MARDFEDLHDLEALDDVELRDLVRERLAETSGVDAENITVHVENGTVHLIGRVGTEGELRIAEHVITDTLGIQDYENELVVDANRRSEQSEDATDRTEIDGDGGYLGDRPSDQDDGSTGHAEDVEAQLYGTNDVQEAIGEGQSYTPPMEPTPEGMSGTDRLPETSAEDH